MQKLACDISLSELLCVCNLINVGKYRLCPHAGGTVTAPESYTFLSKDVNASCEWPLRDCDD